jgi:hypothetical protein
VQIDDHPAAGLFTAVKFIVKLPVRYFIVHWFLPVSACPAIATGSILKKTNLQQEICLNKLEDRMNEHRKIGSVY